MSSREFIELRRALERLRSALIEAMRALEGKEGAASDYAAFGSPFGDDIRSRDIWLAFGQFTTRN